MIRGEGCGKTVTDRVMYVAKPGLMRRDTSPHTKRHTENKMCRVGGDGKVERPSNSVWLFLDTLLHILYLFTYHVSLRERLT